MEAHFEQSERHIRKPTTENEKSMKSVEQKMSEDIKSTEEKCLQKIGSLEKKNVAQKEKIERLETVIPTLFEDAQEMREFMDGIYESINGSPPSP